jgi:hypothetical protein
VAAFDARARHVQLFRFVWWPIVVVWWGIVWVLWHIIRFIGSVPYRFLARVTGTVIVFALALVVFHNWLAERRWTAFRGRITAKGIALRSPRILEGKVAERENLAAGYPFNSAKKMPMGGILLDTNWRPPNFIPLSSGKRPDFTVSFKDKRIRRLWAQRLRDGKHVSQSRLRESSPVRPTPQVFLAFFDGAVADAWNCVIRNEMRPNTRFDRIVAESGLGSSKWRRIPSDKFTSVTELHVLRAVSLIELGRGHEAVDEIRRIWKLYHALESDSGPTIGVQLRVLESGLNTIWAGLDKHAWSETDLDEFDRLIEGTHVMASYSDAVCEYQCAVNDVLEDFLGLEWNQRLRGLEGVATRAFEYALTPQQNLGANPTRRLDAMCSRWLAELNVEELLLLSDGCIRDEQLAINEYFEMLRNQIEEIETQDREKQAGCELLRNTRSCLSSHALVCSIAERHRRMSVGAIGALAQLRQARTAIAIERFQRRENRFPGKLEVLIPEYMKGIPVDPFDGQAMRYAVDGPDSYRLWAVGENLSDEKGAQMAGKGGPDVVWRRLPPK